jgi:hypothetical protein
VLAVAALVWGVITLSHSRLIHDDDAETLAPEPPVNVRLNVDV